MKSDFFNLILKKIQHPDPGLQALWNCTLLSLFLFPLLPAFGAVGLVIIALVICKQQLKDIIQRRINWGLAILAGWLLITVCFAFKPLEALLGLANLLPFFLIFAAYSTLIQTFAQLQQMAWVIVLPSLPVVILGFGQLFWDWSTLTQLQPILGWVLEPNGFPIGRMASVFMYANTLAAYLQIVFILGLGLWLETYKIFSQRRSDWLKLGFLSVSVIASAIALILTDSRNAWGIIIISCLAFALYQAWYWLVAIVTAIATSILGAAFAPSPLQEALRAIVPEFFWARLTDQNFSDRPIALMRLTQWKFALWMTQQRPLTGWGLRNFTPLYEAQNHIWLGHPHNLLLMFTAETGIPTTLLFFGLVGWILAKGALVLVQVSTHSSHDKLILFTYLLAFGGCTLFNTVDVTLFDLRVNTLGWLLLAAIGGIVYKYPEIRLRSRVAN
jgi:O-antigen ligase